MIMSLSAKIEMSPWNVYKVLLNEEDRDEKKGNGDNEFGRVKEVGDHQEDDG